VDAGPETADASCSPEPDEAPVDLVLALDTSGSMQPVACNAIANLADLSEQAGPNLRLVAVYQEDIVWQLITSVNCGSAAAVLFGETALTSDPERFLHVPYAVDSTNAFGALLATFDSYRDLLRPEASVHVAVISDDESAMAAAEFQDALESRLERSFSFHAVVAAGEGDATCPGPAAGLEYRTLADATSGTTLSICRPDWGGDLAGLTGNSCLAP
jgi:hypothetical protein